MSQDLDYFSKMTYMHLQEKIICMSNLPYEEGQRGYAVRVTKVISSLIVGANPPLNENLHSTTFHKMPRKFFVSGSRQLLTRSPI